MGVNQQIAADPAAPVTNQPRATQCHTETYTTTAVKFDAPTAAVINIADRLADAERLHSALDRQQTTAKAAQAANADALATQAGNDAAQATTTDAAEAKRLEAQGRKLAATVAETLADLDRARRIETAIRDDAEPARRMVTEWAHQVAGQHQGTGQHQGSKADRTVDRLIG